MFERFWKTTQKSQESDQASEKNEDLSDQELAEMIERVQEQVLGTPNESSEKSTIGNAIEENKHPVKTAADVEREKNAAANPHGFTEIK